MRTMKKTIAFVLAFAMTFATAFSAMGAKVTASAAAGDEAFKVKVNTDGSFTAVGVNEELQVGIVTIKKGVASIKNWDTYKVDKTMYVDDVTDPDVVESTASTKVQVFGATGFITLAPKKDMVVAFRTVEKNADKTASIASYTDPTFWEIQKNASKYKAKVTIDKSNDKAIIKVNDANWTDTKYSAYSSLTDAPVDSNGIINEVLYNVGGAIQVTPKGATTGLTAVNTKFTYLTDDNASVESVIQSDAKAVTVKLKKRANAPKVSINYAKSTASIPKNAEYKIITDAANWAEAYATSSDKKSVALSGSEGLIQIKKAATEKALASKVGVSTYKAADEVEVSGTTSDGLLVSYKDGGDLALENKSKVDVIEYFVGTAAPTDAAKWTKVKVGGKSTIKAAKVDKKAKVYARRAANAKNFLIASAVTPNTKDANTGAITSIDGYDYAAAADAAKTAVTPTATMNDKVITVTFSANITGTATVTNGNKKYEEQINGSSVTITCDETVTASKVTITLSDEAAKSYKFVNGGKAVSTIDVTIS